MASPRRERSSAGQWQLGALAASEYHRCLVPVVFGPWAEELVRRANLQHGDRLLDLACGTGAVTAIAAGRIGEQGTVYGLDLNPEMLEVAQARCKDSECEIQWRIGNAEQLPFPEAAFDTVLCQQGLQFFANRHRALTEISRVLRPGGRVLASVWNRSSENPWAEALIQALENHPLADLADCLRQPFSLADAGELAVLFQGAGFRDVAVELAGIGLKIDDGERFWSGFLSALPIGLPPHQREGLAREVSSGLAPFQQDGVYEIPSEAF